MKVIFPIKKIFTIYLMAFLCLAASGPSALAAGGKISGQVTNGTTERPVANQALVLLMPRGGMQPVGAFVTDAAGKFEYSASDLSTDSFYLLQANYQGVDYNTPVKFDDRGQARVDVTVYEATHSAPSIRIQSSRIILRAEGSTVHVQEMFAVRNSSNPPRSYTNSEGTFLFHLGKSNTAPTAAVTGLMEMPLPQPVNPGKGEGNYNLQYPFKPGVTVVMVAYDADYAGNKFDLVDSFRYPIDALDLQVSPPSLTVASQLFQPAGTDSETGNQKFTAQEVAAGTQLSASLSGEAGEAQAAGSMPPSGGSTPAPSDGDVKVIPNSMTRMGGLALACLLLVTTRGWASAWPRNGRSGKPSRARAKSKRRWKPISRIFSTRLPIWTSFLPTTRLAKSPTGKSAWN